MKKIFLKINCSSNLVELEFVSKKLNSKTSQLEPMGSPAAPFEECGSADF